MGYFKAPQKAKIKGTGLYFHWHPFRVREVLDCGGIAAKRGLILHIHRPKISPSGMLF
jgi:hypothetical protein